MSATAGDDGHGVPRTGEGRGTAELLLDSHLGPYLLTLVLATAGIWTFNIAAATLVWEMSGSAVAVATISMALFAPQLLLGPVSGAAVDQRDPRGLLVIGRLQVAVASGALAVAILILGVSGLPGTWVVVLASGVIGVGFVVGGPAQLVVLPMLVDGPELPRAVALNSLPPTIGRAAGPALAGALLVTTGPAVAFGFTAVANVAFALVCLRLPTGDSPRATSREGTVRFALAHVGTDPMLGLLLLGMLAVGIGSDPVVTLTPGLSAQFGQGGGLVGAFASAFGGGAGLGFLGMTAIRRRRGLGTLAGSGLMAMSAGLLVCGIASSTAGALVGFGIAGAGFCWANTGITTQIYERVPRHLRGRVMAMWAIAFAGSRPFGAAASGLVADTASVTIALMCVSVAVLGLGLAVILGSARLSRATPAAGSTTLPVTRHKEAPVRHDRMGGPT